MAAEGSTAVTSDELFDYLCFPCNKKDRNSEAVKYCVDCQEYMCVTCEENHNSFSVLAGHTIVGRSKFGNASGADTKHLPSVPTERCKVHSMKLVDMYCADHDSVGCHVCFTINHKPCQGIHYIPEYVQSVPQTQTENIRKIKAEVEKEISEMGEIMKKNKKDISDYKKTKESYLEDIRVFRTEINETLDRLEQAAISEVNEKYDSLAHDSQDELENIEDMLRKLKTCKAEVDSSQRNISQQFVNINLCKNFMSETRKKITKSRDAEIYNITFERNSEILRCLQGFGSLVKQARPRTQSLYQVQSKKSFNVKMNTDVSDCNVWSSCILDSGEILLVDFSNQNIKMIDHKTYKVRNSVKMSDNPKSVCKISSTEAAVSYNNKTVQFLSTKNQLVPVRSLKFDHECRGIAAMDDQLVISEFGKKVYFYTMNGERIKMIDKDQFGQNIFSNNREVCVSDDGKKLHVTDLSRGLITVDLDGNVIWTYSGQELKSACGVCTDGHGNVFVIGESSGNVVQLGSDGKFLGEVVSEADGLSCPRALSFDRSKCKLFVADRNKLHVFQLE